MFQSSKLPVISAFLAISLFAGCGANLVQGGRVATINDEVISQKEFQENYNQIVKMMNIDPTMLKGDTYASMQTMFKKITMQNLILTHLVQQEAKERHLEVMPKEVTEAYEKQVAQMGGEKALKEQLEKMKMTPADFRAEIQKQLLMDKLVQAIAGDKLAVSPDEAKAFYQANQQQFDQPEQVHARHILVGADPKQIKADLMKLKKEAKPEAIDAQVKTTLADKKKKADQLYVEVKANPEKFEAVAKTSSDDQGSAKNGGDLGYFSREAMVPSFSQAAFATKPGQIHEGIVESPFGYHIIQVVDRKPAEKKSFDAVKDRIVTYLQSQRKSQIMENWLDTEKKKAKIVLAPEYDFDKQEQDNAKLVPLKPGDKPEAAAVDSNASEKH